MGLTFFLATYLFSTVLIGGILLWRYKREAEQRLRLLFVLLLWLLVPVIVWLVPANRIPAWRFNWLSIAGLLMLTGAIAYQYWKKPAARRFYAILWIPILAINVVLQIALPLFWRR
jgi:hypothetical protein